MLQRIVTEIVAHAASAATLGWCMLVSDNAVRGSARTQFAAVTVSGGPSPATPNILSALKDYNGRATFFVTLANAQRHTGLLMAIVEDGHSIGIQGTCEADFMGWQSEAEARAAKAFLNSKGISVHYYRPPICGTYSPRVARAVAGLKLKMVFWNVYPWDFVGTPADICGRYASLACPVVLHAHSSRVRVPRHTACSGTCLRVATCTCSPRHCPLPCARLARQLLPTRASPTLLPLCCATCRRPRSKLCV